MAARGSNGALRMPQAAIPSRFFRGVLPIHARVVARLSSFCTLPVLLLVGCRRGGDSQPPVATPSITINRAKAALGSPLEITYRFEVAKDAPKFGQDYTVMVHFVDSDEELMWTDDHRPPVPTTQWKPRADGRVHADGLRPGVPVPRRCGNPGRSLLEQGFRPAAAGRAGFGTARLQGGIAAVARPDRERVPDLQGRVAPARGSPRRTPSSNGSGRRGRQRSCSATRSVTARSTCTPTTRAALSTNRRTSISCSTGSRSIASRSRRSRSTSSGPR